jgi:hypothetical protein
VEDVVPRLRIHAAVAVVPVGMPEPDLEKHVDLDRFDVQLVEHESRDCAIGEVRRYPVASQSPAPDDDLPDGAGDAQHLRMATESVVNLHPRHRTPPCIAASVSLPSRGFTIDAVGFEKQATIALTTNRSRPLTGDTQTRHDVTGSRGCS